VVLDYWRFYSLVALHQRELWVNDFLEKEPMTDGKSLITKWPSGEGDDSWSGMVVIKTDCCRRFRAKLLSDYV
jgi:hypothetical protein